MKNALLLAVILISQISWSQNRPEATFVEKGKQLDEVKEGTLVRDEEEKFYVYKQVMGEHSQVGIVVTASLDAYEKT